MLFAAGLDTHALLKVIYVSLGAGVVLVVAFAVASRASHRSFELARDGQRPAALALGVIGALAALVCIAGLALGVYYVTQK
jgi:hypothetical protein